MELVIEKLEASLDYLQSKLDWEVDRHRRSTLNHFEEVDGLRKEISQVEGALEVLRRSA